MVRTPALRASISWTEMSLPVEFVGFLVSKWRWQSPRKSGIHRFLDRTEGQKSELFYQNMKNVGPWRWFSRCRVGHTSVRTWVQILRLHRRPEPAVHTHDPSASTTKWETDTEPRNHRPASLVYVHCSHQQETLSQIQTLKSNTRGCPSATNVKNVHIHTLHTYTQRWKY